MTKAEMKTELHKLIAETIAVVVTGSKLTMGLKAPGLKARAEKLLETIIDKLPEEGPTHGT